MSKDVVLRVMVATRRNRTTPGRAAVIEGTRWWAKVRAQRARKLNDKQADYGKLYKENKELQADYDQQRTKLKEVGVKLKKQEEAFQQQTKRTNDSGEGHSCSSRQEDSGNYNLKIQNFEMQFQSAIATIKRLKQEKKEVTLKAEMGATRITAGEKNSGYLGSIMEGMVGASGGITDVSGLR